VLWLSLRDAPKHSRERRLHSEQNCGSLFPGKQEPLPFDVVAMHFFRFNDKYLSDGRNALFSITYQLAQKISGYWLHLSTKEEWQELDLMTIFRLLVVDPYNAIEPMARHRWTVIDGLDECAVKQRQDSISALRSKWTETPKWMRLLVTRRPEAHIPENLRAFEPEEMSTGSVQKMKDMKVFLRHKLHQRILPEHLNKAVSKLLKLSDGLFLDARFIDHTLKEVKGSLNLDQLDRYFPDNGENMSALDAIYYRYFQRLHSSILNDSEDEPQLLQLALPFRSPLLLTFSSKHAQTLKPRNSRN